VLRSQPPLVIDSKDNMKIRIVASRHTAFYSPLISTMAAGFLEAHGLEYTYGVLGPGETAAGMIRDGKTDIMQSAPSTNWAKMDKGETGFPLHFALINRRDGFFLSAQGKANSFAWKDLEGETLIADHGSQPLAMLRYAVHYNGVDWEKIKVVDAGTPEQMMEAFRAGKGDFVHLQAPAPQLLEEEGIGWTAVSIGESMPPNAFSSLCASREFIGSPPFCAFVKAFAEARAWVGETPAEEIAAREAPHFPRVSQRALTSAIARYKIMGAWEGGIEIPRDLYEQSLNVFEFSGRIKQRQPYDLVCAVM
jgi:NitT/TauT family transport system substrate-binding protein